MTLLSRIESHGGQVRLCPWLICERGHRFATAAHRFAPTMTPVDGVPSIDSTSVAMCRDQIEPLIRSGTPSVILWSIPREDMLTVLDQAIALANHPSQILRRRILPMVACDQLSRGGELALAETGVSVFLRNPEDLPMYSPMIQAHFASFASGLK